MMESSTKIDLLLLAIPAMGAAVNLLAQFLFARVLLGGRLLATIVAAFALGGVATLILVAAALAATPQPPLDALGLAASLLIIYGAAGLVLFALINLGETSLRIRMLKHLMMSADGLSEAALLATYDNTELISVRLQRLKDKRQVAFRNGVFYPKLSFLFIAAAGVRMLQRLIFGSRRSAA